MKQFSIQALFGVLTLAAIVCGIIYWLGFDARVFSFCAFLLGGPLAGAIIGLCSAESINVPRNSIIGGACGGMAGCLVFFCLSLVPTLGFFSMPVALSLVNSLFWLYGLATAFIFGVMVGFAIALGWTLTTIWRKRRSL